MVALPYPQCYLDWCQNLVDSVRDGGVWAIPRSSLVFRLSKRDKTLTLVSGDPESDDVVQTSRAFAEIGWRVVT